ncbi:elastase-1-like [Colossoma macropomum]|uniref:elastase-1-like n=1 Tax=Colossoma macropomum TaxID=42526 RepID=UPI0018648FE4|nr:elastase-1-like [Colossoma macropomum]
MLRIIYLTTSAALVFAQPQPQSRVVGGEVAKPNFWPWQASLQALQGSRYRHVCGGVLIKKQWVLTAAHCFETANVSLVVLGDHDLTKSEGKEQLHKVKRTYIHPAWDKNQGNDIALILLSTEATLNSYVKLATLPPSDQMPSAKWTCYITGWGSTEIGGLPSVVLKQAFLPIIDFPTCSCAWWGSAVKDNMICAGGGSNYGCYGDSGGPLNCLVSGQYVVHGLTSFVHCAECNRQATIFSRVSAFLPWVNQVIALQDMNT